MIYIQKPSILYPLFFTLLLAAIPYISNAQDTDIDTSLTWVIVDYSMGECLQANSYKILNDTIIDEQLHHKLYETVGGPFDKNNCTFHSTIRDSSGYWFINGDLCYNYNYNLGDTIDYESGDYVYLNGLVVYEVDSIFIGGEMKKYLALGTWEDWAGGSWIPIDTWIEGLGSTYGLFYPGFWTIDYGFALSCLFRNDTLFHHFDFFNSWWDSCYCDEINTYLDYKDGESSFYLYPNPTNGIVHLPDHFSYDDIKEIQVTNIYGNKFPVTWEKENTLRLPDVQGLYFVNLHMTNGDQQTFKVTVLAK